MIKINIECSRSDFSLHINETFPSRGITAIFGRSGAGKTMLINAISGLLTPNKGEISIDHTSLFDSERKINLPPEKRAIGYVFQDARLFPHMSVLKNLLYGAKEKNPQFADIISLLDIEHLLARHPSNLSGGEKQRVAIGRALLSNPKLLIMDEPTAALDQPRRVELIQYLLRLTSAISIPLLYISHHLDEVMRLADHMLVLNKGRVDANNSINKVWHSAAMQPWFAAKEHSSLINAMIMENHPHYPLTALNVDTQTLWIPQSDEPKGSLVRLSLLAKDISITTTKAQDSSIKNVLVAKIISIVPQANQPYCHVRLAVGKEYLVATITLWAANELGLAPEMQVFAQLNSINIAKTDISLTEANAAIQ